MADRKIYFATDIHGSEVCLRKFLNAGKFYGCDTLIMGGDITGKMIVPIVDRGQGVHTATLYGRNARGRPATAWPSCARRSPTPATTPTRRRPRRWSASAPTRTR